jgi:hypothetical protein
MAAMEKDVRKNTKLTGIARAQAESIIKNYISEIGELTRTDYKVTFAENADKATTESSTATAATE